ncbi:MAG: tetratricopeptide repeat protein [Candidatus Omnitrophota bacterium]
MKRLLIAACMIIFACGSACAQPPQASKDKDFSKEILSAKTDIEAAEILEEAQGAFFEQNRYQEFVDLLASAAKKKKTIAPLADYYTGAARYQQMKYLEETQNWDEYFSKGNDYRKDITDNLDRAVRAFPEADPLRVYSRLILWRFHKDQQDVFNEQALEDLMAAVKVYAAEAKDLKPLKAVADKLLDYDVKDKAKELYKLYGEKVISSDLSDDELQNTAMSFYKQGTMELAQALYTVYIDRISKSASPDKVKLEMIDIAELFSYKKDGAYDIDYAEKIFSRIEEMFGPDVFDEGLAYQRALNAEKNKDYTRAKELYTSFSGSYPQSEHFEGALLKTGIIALYVDKDIKAAQEIFGRLAGQPVVSAQAITGLYYLGLIAQWQGENALAKEYYTKLIESAKDGFGETVSLANARLLEIEESRPLEFNIKTMLDMTLKPENSRFSMNRVDIKASPSEVSPGGELTVTANATPPESGCMQVQLQYFWSGDTGKGAASYQENSFTTSYADPGIKIIGLVVTTPAGVVDRGIEFIDVI